jgi:ankyrin repeat protein
MIKHKWLILIVLLIPGFALTGCKTGDENKKAVEKYVSDKAQQQVPVPVVSIHEAALNGQLTPVTDLLSQGFDVNSLDEDGRTALMYASFNGHVELIRKLIEKGAQINLYDIYGRTALMMASSGPYPDAVKVLLDHYADPNITDKEEHFTALMFAASEGQLDVVKILLAYKADPFLKDIDGDDAMSFASKNGHKEVVALLQSLK